MSWEVILLDEVEEWFLGLAQEEADHVDAVTAAIDLLAASGPTLGRPVKGWYEVNIPLAEQRYNAWLDGHYNEGVD